MRLHYLPEGDPRVTQQWVAGWPASDHDEPDEALAEEKVRSGLYAEATPEQAVEWPEPEPAAATVPDGADQPAQEE